MSTVSGQIQAVSNVRDSKSDQAEANFAIKMGDDNWYNIDGDWDDLEKKQARCVNLKIKKKNVNFEVEKKGQTYVIKGKVNEGTGSQKKPTGDDDDEEAPKEERVGINATQDTRAATVTQYRECMEDAWAAFKSATGNEMSWGKLTEAEKAGILAWATSIRISRR